MKTARPARILSHQFTLCSWPLRLALLGVLLFAGVTSAKADSVNFVLSDGTGNTMTWTLPSSRSPDAVFPKGFTMNGVSVLENGTTTVTADITFWNLTVNDGAESACAPSPCGTGVGLFDVFDYLVYSGTEAHPTFIPGTYTEPAGEDDAAKAANLGCPAGTVEADESCGVGDRWALSSSPDVNFTLTITRVPEPSSLLLLGSGLVGLMGIRLRRKRLV